MYKLYGMFIVMLILAIIFLIIPFFKNPTKNILGFLLLSTSVAVISLSLYRQVSPQWPLRQWLTTGEQHYQLAVEVNKLGGIDGIIQQIKNKLAKNPNDAQGWLILGKLYLGKHDYPAAKKALENAHRHPRESALSSGKSIS